MPERATSTAPEGLLFEETQRLGGWWWAALGGGLLGVGVLVGAMVRSHYPLEVPTLVGLGAGALVLFIAATSKLVTRVTTAGAEVRFPPFPWTTTRVRPADIAEVTTKRFGMFDWPGGVGYHMSFGGTAATARTGTGVLVRRKNGRFLLVGTERPEALRDALLQLQRAAAVGAR